MTITTLTEAPGTPASIKDELHELVDAMDETEAVRLLAMIGLRTDPDDLTPEEEASIIEAMKDFDEGRTIRGEDLERELGLGDAL